MAQPVSNASDQSPPRQAPQEYKDLGFGTKIQDAHIRLINPDGTFNVRKTGGGLGAVNPYQYLILAPWWKFLLLVLGLYVVVNCMFACLYLAAGIENLTGELGADAPMPTFWEDFWHAFFFSVQTYTTVGYGSVSPKGLMTNTLAAFEAMFGVMTFALATGLLYGRFSRPSAKIRFSEKMIIAPYQDINSLQVRIVNRRQNQLIELEVLLTLSWYEMVQGERKQRFFTLDLERSSVALFPLSWTIVHPITRESPLYDISPEILASRQAEVFVIIKAFDDTFAQVVHVRRSYRAEEITWGARFVPAFYPDPASGKIILNINKTGACEAAQLNKY
ncbi:MAG: ion channel [Bacteroidia bacterium]|nr:ion channel [Bacteroidia bacterium]